MLISLVFVVLGVLLLLLSRYLALHHPNDWFGLLPVGELGGTFIGAGILSIWLDRALRSEQAALDELRLRRLLREQAPVMRDAVLEAFAANHEDLRRVATPETLDGIIRSALAIRLEDEQFATEIFDDIRSQAVDARERLYDASLSIDLSPWDATPRKSEGGGFRVTA